MNHPHALVSPTTDLHQLQFVQAGLLCLVDGGGHLPHIDITFTGHLSNQQIQGLEFALKHATGLFSRFLHLAYHVNSVHHPLLLTTLLKNIPANARSFDIFYTRPHERVNVRVLAKCSSRRKGTQRVTVSIPVDHDIRQLEANLDHGILSSVGSLEIQTPISEECFFHNQCDMLGPIRAFIASLHHSLQNVTLVMSSPTGVSSILVSLGRSVNLKTLRLTCGWHCPVEDIQCAILYGLTRFQRMPDLFLPGSFFSWDLFLGLGNLPILNLSFESEIPRAFLPSSINTPRADALQFNMNSTGAAVNRVQIFRHLQSLTLTTSFDLVLDMYTVLAPIGSMKQLILTTPILDAPMEATQMYRRIAALFPSLTSFRWEVKRAHHLESPSWLDIPGLLSFEHLDDLSITHPFPLALDDATFARFLHAWPLMTRLNLNPCPRIHTWPPAHSNENGGADVNEGVASLTWDVLRGPVRRNGVLKALGVYLGAQEHACAPVRGGLSKVMDGNIVLLHLLLGTNGPMHPDSGAVLDEMFKRAAVKNSF